jgi:hypothetical protein
MSAELVPAQFDAEAKRAQLSTSVIFTQACDARDLNRARLRKKRRVPITD